MLQREKVCQAVSILSELDVDMWVTLGRETSMNNDPVLPLIASVDFGAFTAVIVTKTGRICTIAGHLDEDGIRKTGVYDEVIGYDLSFKEKFFMVMNQIKPSKIALNYSETDVSSDGLSYGLYLKIMSLFKEFDYKGEIISAQNIIGKLRGRKTKTEVDRMLEAIKYSDMIFEDAKAFIKEGVTEKQVHSFFHERLKHYGVQASWQASQCPGVMMGPDTVMGHTGPTDLAGKKGDTVTVDFGVMVDDYCSDIQRVYYILKDGETKAPEEVQKAFDTIHEGVRRGMSVMKPGTKGYEADAAAREYAVSQGYPTFNFGFGHQVGRRCHDGGLLMAPRWERYEGNVEQSMEEGMVFTVDINLGTSAGRVGQEDMAIVTKEGAVFLTTPQKEIYLV